MKGRKLKGFGDRLAKLRKSKGMTQAELGKKVGVSYRVIAYYEHESGQPPGAMLVDLAKALQVSADQLLGIKKVKETEDPKTARMVKRLKRISLLPKQDQQAVMKFLDALVQKQTAESK